VLYLEGTFINNFVTLQIFLSAAPHYLIM